MPACPEVASVNTPTFRPSSCRRFAIPCRVMTKMPMCGSALRRITTVSLPLRTSSATGTVPVCENSQSPRMSPAALSGPPTSRAGNPTSTPCLRKIPASVPIQGIDWTVARRPIVMRTSVSACARAASGHATAAPPISVMNSRRLMGLTPKATDHRTKYSRFGVSVAWHRNKNAHLMSE